MEQGTLVEGHTRALEVIAQSCGLVVFHHQPDPFGYCWNIGDPRGRWIATIRLSATEIIQLDSLPKPEQREFLEKKFTEALGVIP